MNLRCITSIALALVLLVTSQAMAVARGSTDATGQMVICVGDGTQILYTDAQGTPTTAPHICPDCVLLLAFTATAPVLSERDRADLTLHVPIEAFAAITHGWLPVPPTRGPPLSI